MTHILLVEPDRLQAESIIAALTLKDVHVSWARNAQTAIEIADTHMPNIVVLELVLGAHNGVEFLYEFRSYNEWSHIPVIVFSMQRVNDVGLFKKLGVQACLYKPATTLAQLFSEVAGLRYVATP